MMRRCKKKNGFTLLEVMVSLAIVAVVLVSLLISQSQSVSLQDEIKFKTTAALLAQKKISEIELEKTDKLNSDNGDFGDDFADYSWETIVQDISLPDSLSEYMELEDFTKYLRQVDVNIYRGEEKRSQYNIRLYRFVP
ncbi:MAG: type II secretion system protein [Deltaproteobacteria bacterium]|nr:type II secretion system protein [Deltaproteobacteria bacterium]